MTVINQNSISGINSVTAESNTIRIHDNGGVERVCINSGNVGIGTDNPDRLLHVVSSDIGITPSPNTHMVIESQSNTGLNILTNSNQNGQILFGDSDDADIGRIQYNHTDNYMAFFTSAIERLRISSGGYIGINSTTPTLGLDINRGANSGVYLGHPVNGYKLRANVSSSVNGGFLIEDESGVDLYAVRSNGAGSNPNTHKFYVNGNERVGITSESNGTSNLEIANGNLVFSTSGTGIDFSATADGSGASNVNELLDDYEEGTFTPSLTFATPGTSSFSYSVQSGWYTKVGRMAHYRLELRLTAFSKGTASGDLRISGLPFTTADFGAGQFSGSFAAFAAPLPTTAGHFPWFGARLNSTEAFFKVLRDDNGWDVFPDPDNNSQYKCDVTVFTA